MGPSPCGVRHLQPPASPGGQDAVEAVAALDGLRRGLRRAEAVDIAWLLSDPVLYRRLVGVRGWPVARFEKWLAATLRQQLLAEPDA